MVLKITFIRFLGLISFIVVLFLVIKILDLKFFFLYFSFKTLFRLLLSFLRGFYVFGRIFCRFWLLGLKLGFFNSKIFYSGTLSLYLEHNNLSKAIALLSLVIYLLNIGNRLEASFSLNLDDSFFNHLFSDI